jgi:hypothetical protein
MKTFFALILALILAGCSARIPDIYISSADSAVVVAHKMVGRHDTPDRSTLSPTQIAQLANWFSEHRSGWYQKLEDTAPAVEIYLKRNGAPVAWVNIHPDFIQTGWGKVGGGYRTLSTDERTALQAIIDGKNG